MCTVHASSAPLSFRDQLSPTHRLKSALAASPSWSARMRSMASSSACRVACGRECVECRCTQYVGAQFGRWAGRCGGKRKRALLTTACAQHYTAEPPGHCRAPLLAGCSSVCVRLLCSQAAAQCPVRKPPALAQKHRAALAAHVSCVVCHVEAAADHLAIPHDDTPAPRRQQL